MRSLVTRFLPALALLAGFATPAMAQEGRDEVYPIVNGQRPITLHKGQFLVDLDFVYQNNPDPIDANIFADVALEYGVIKNLTVGTLPVTLGLSPEAEVTHAAAFARYRFLYGQTFPLELAAELQVLFPFEDGRDFGVAPGVRARWFINNAARLDFGLFLPITFADPDAVIGLALPVELTVSVARQIFVGVETGFVYPNFDFSVFQVPLGLKVGYTIARNAESPFLDIYLGFAFPGFLSGSETIDLGTGESTTETDVNTDVWQIMVGARFFAN